MPVENSLKPKNLSGKNDNTARAVHVLWQGSKNRLPFLPLPCYFRFSFRKRKNHRYSFIPVTPGIRDVLYAGFSPHFPPTFVLRRLSFGW
ncbi:hypothetical protein CDAR_534101 [Caerostris darwini]|uniref:Uncharacterized protein n=1 Tax=Caerostris darwini TaxID=1538125 RepID=A0AAV4SC65_9ARAC|nr:hypothetical protein CDAR_534101 [Caerostris darwini]